VELSGLQKSAQAVEFFKRRHVIYSLIADHMVNIASNVYYVAAIMLIGKYESSIILLSELMLIYQISMLLTLPVAGLLGERFGARNTLFASLILTALVPLAFYFAVGGSVRIRMVACGAGVVMGLNFPTSSAYTFTIVPQTLLSRIFLFVMITSLIDCVGLLVSPYLYAVAPWVPFGVASAMYCLGGVVYYRGTRPSEEYEETTECDPQPWSLKGRVTATVQMFAKGRFCQFAGASIVLSLVMIVIMFMVPARVIMPQMKASPEAARGVGHMLILLLGAGMIVMVLADYVFKITIKTVLNAFLAVGLASGLITVFWDNVKVVCLVIGVTLPFVFQAGKAIFTLMREAFDVKSPASHSVFQLTSSLGSIMAYGLLRTMLGRCDLRWIVGGIACLCLTIVFVGMLTTMAVARRNAANV
jgi:MFS family permease